MNWRDLPPLAALRAFAAYAETGSVAKAGEALSVSHAAISQQLRQLEAHLGLSLLDRSGRSLALTADGAALAAALRDGFERIASTVAALTGAEATRPLHITTTPGFAANWLMPRLARYRERHPDAALMIDPSPQLSDPAPGGIDVALRYGAGDWPGLEAEMLVVSPIVVVAAPSLLGDLDPVRPEDLTRFPWLQELGTSEASTWLAQKGVPNAKPASLVSVPGNLMVDGARNGQGIAVAALVSVADDVKAGRLRVLFREDDQRGYYIVTAPGIPRPALKEFVRWLRAEARVA